MAINLHGNNSHKKANILHLLGMNYNGLSQYDNALESYKKSLRIDKSLKDQRNSVAITLLNIGAVYANTNNNKKAIEFYEESLTIKK